MPTRTSQPSPTNQARQIRLAIAGVGNCASSLVQGITYYRDADPDEVVPGLMHVELGGELIDSGHVTIQNLAAELGIPLNDFSAPNVNDAGAAQNLDMLAITGFVGGKKLTQADIAAQTFLTRELKVIADQFRAAHPDFTDKTETIAVLRTFGEGRRIAIDVIPTDAGVLAPETARAARSTGSQP